MTGSPGSGGKEPASTGGAVSSGGATSAGVERCQWHFERHRLLPRHGERLGAGREVTFEDPGLAWYRAWNVQPENGDDFVVSTFQGNTTVRLSTDFVALNPVSLFPAESRMGWATMVGTARTNLEIRAHILDGTSEDKLVWSVCRAQ